MGLGLPLLMAVFAVPGLLALIGSERFGFLALAWGLIGYAGALDLGIGRATTQRVSILRSGRYQNQIPDVVSTAIRITSATGVAGMLLICIAASAGAYRLINASEVPASEIEISMYMLALALPMQAVSATYRGVNEAYLNFKGINILRTGLGVANFGAPYLVAIYTKEVHWLVATLVVSRFLALLIYRYLARLCILENLDHKRGQYVKLHAMNLLKFGGWFTVTNIVGPIMVQADRFFIGALVSATSVTLYVIPYEIAIQSLVFVGALTTVIFPVVAGLIKNSPGKVMVVFNLWLKRIVGAMFIIMALLAYLMPTVLSLWVGGHVTEDSVWVGRILCFGVFVNGIGAMYFSLLHAQGFVKKTAILHLVEFPFYLIILVKLIMLYGVIGCAIAWVMRTAIDTIILIWISKRTMLVMGGKNDTI